MNAIYYPILKAKGAEFETLDHASSIVHENIIPLFEMPVFNPELKKWMDNPAPKVTFLDETTDAIASLRAGTEVLFDTYQWEIPGEILENREYALSYIYNCLISKGVKAIPVAAYDRWEDEEYRSALKSISKFHTGRFCLRLEEFAFDDAEEPLHLLGRLQEILNHLEIEPFNCHVILDMQDLSLQNLDSIVGRFKTLFDQIKIFDFGSYSIAGCSLPSSIDKIIDKDTAGTIPRLEMKLWQYARRSYAEYDIRFGDYVVRGPHTTESGYGNTNAKIRYTVDGEIYLIRGHVIRKPIGGFQHCELARKLLGSGYYLYPRFSWGDTQIERCAKGEIGGAAAQWIVIDSSHHLEFVVTELQRATRPTTTPEETFEEGL